MTTDLLAPPARLWTPDDLGIVDAATRREFIAMLGAAGLLAACGGGDDGEEQETAQATRTFRDALGDDIVIPDRPRRIVADRDLMAARLLALGGPVVGFPTVGGGRFREEFARQFDLGDIVGIGDAPELDLERVFGLEPDLIVIGVLGGEISDVAQVERLREIAPVVALENFVDLETATATAAELLGPAASTTADDALADFEEALAELRDVLGPRWSEATVSVVLYRGTDAIYTWGRRAVPPTDVLDRLGVSWVAATDEADRNGGDLQLSQERLSDLSADLIVTTHLGYDGVRRITDEPTFAALPAVRAGQVIDLDDSYFGVTPRTYAEYARFLTERLRQIGDLRTDLV